MLAYKLGGLLIGGILLVPLIWAFASMAIRADRINASTQQSFEEARTQLQEDLSKVEGPGVFMGMRVEATFTPIPPLGRFLGFYPRKWVGVCGAALSIALLALWAFSVLVPAKSWSAGGGSDFTEEFELPGGVNNENPNFWHNDQHKKLE